MESSLSAEDIESLSIEMVEAHEHQNRQQIDESFGDDETLEVLEFDDDDYVPGTKKVVSSSKNIRTTRATSSAKKVGAEPKRKEKALKKDIELPIKIELIELVKNQSSLYNLKDPLYVSRTNKDKVWLSISDALKEKYPGMDVEKCKRMWNSVRESTR